MADAYSITSKSCSKCKAEKPLSEFSKRKNSSDGLRSACRACASEEYKSWASINRKPKPEPERHWYAENGDLVSKLCSSCELQKAPSEFHRSAGHKHGISPHCKACVRKRADDWYSENRERGRATRNAYYDKNSERLLLRMRQYRADNLEKALAREKAYRISHRAEKSARDRVWQAENPEKLLVYRRVSEARRRAQKIGSAEHYTAEDIQRLHTKQRGKCACCKRSLSRGYHIDHVIALSKGGGNGPLNIQLLCATCNIRKSAKDPIDFMQENGFLI